MALVDPVQVSRVATSSEIRMILVGLPLGMQTNGLRLADASVRDRAAGEPRNQARVLHKDCSPCSLRQASPDRPADLGDEDRRRIRGDATIEDGQRDGRDGDRNHPALQIDASAIIFAPGSRLEGYSLSSGGPADRVDRSLV
jgi:hypothetical protein